MKHFRANRLKRFWKDEDGAHLVEFALLVPMLFLIFAAIIVSGRIFWSYQSTIAGVRDATRYLSRAAPRDICLTGGSVAGFQGQLETIVRTTSSGATLFPSNVTVNSVVPSVACVAGTYRGGNAPIATVTASLTITIPFSGIFSFHGGQGLSTINTTVVDQNRIYGT